jgi:hypothetical protein
MDVKFPISLAFIFIMTILFTLKKLMKVNTSTTKFFKAEKLDVSPRDGYENQANPITNYRP